VNITSMANAAAILHRLGRPGAIRLGATPTGTPSRLATRLAPLDATLDGGLPRGRVSELTGARSTGRTALACAIAAGATGAGEAIAWVDPEDALDPEAAAQSGLVLERTLWVRPRTLDDAIRATDLLLAAGGFALVVLDVAESPPHPHIHWTRLARAAERTRTALLVVSKHSHTGATAALTLEATARRVRWSGEPGRLVLLDGLTCRVLVARNRLGPPGGAIVLRQACA
jgi:RecA/RadA recombinase